MLSGLEDTADNGPKVNTYNLRSARAWSCVGFAKFVVALSERSVLLTDPVHTCERQDDRRRGASTSR